MDIQKEVEIIKNRMSWSEYISKGFQSLFWLSPFGYLTDSNRFHLYWYILYYI